MRLLFCIGTQDHTLSVSVDVPNGFGKLSSERDRHGGKPFEGCSCRFVATSLACITSRSEHVCAVSIFMVSRSVVSLIRCMQWFRFPCSTPSPRVSSVVDWQTLSPAAWLEQFAPPESLMQPGVVRTPALSHMVPCNFEPSVARFRLVMYFGPSRQGEGLRILRAGARVSSAGW